MSDEELRGLERARDEAPDDLAALRRWADAHKRAGLELLPSRIYDDEWPWLIMLADPPQTYPTYEELHAPEIAALSRTMEEFGAVAARHWNALARELLEGNPVEYDRGQESAPRNRES